MKELEAECKGIANISSCGQNGKMKVTLQEVDLSFLEENHSFKMVDVSGGVE